MNFDLFIFQKINQFAGKWFCLDNFVIFFAKYFEYFLIFFLLLFLVKNFKKYWSMVIQTFLAAILARLVIVSFIRQLLPRPRPFVENQVNLLLDSVNTASFPSGHATFYFAITTVVFLYLKKNHPQPRFWWGVGLFFFLASFLISISRVFVGIHWPSDILAGFFVGIFSGWLTFILFQKFFPKTKELG